MGCQLGSYADERGCLLEFLRRAALLWRTQSRGGRGGQVEGREIVGDRGQSERDEGKDKDKMNQREGGSH